MFGGEVNGSVAPSPTNGVNSMRTVYRTDVYDVASDSWNAGTVRQPLLICSIVPACRRTRRTDGVKNLQFVLCFGVCGFAAAVSFCTWMAALMLLIHEVLVMMMLGSAANDTSSL